MKNPTNGELKITIQAMENLLDEKIADLKADLAEINDRVRTTNGRLKNLELWRSFLIGAWAVLTAMVIPLLIYIFIQKINLDSSVSSAIEKTLNAKIQTVQVEP